jgi:hypothetical protein
MAKSGGMNWYGDKVKLEVKRDGAKALLAIGFQVEGQAKVNITNNGQVDTGFMRNSVYTTGGGQSNYSQAAHSGEYTSQKQGDTVDRTLAPELSAGGDDVYVVVGASYAIYQELANSFLFRALEQVKAGGADIAIKKASRG